MKIMNPVLPGFHPDPSIIRVEDCYYIAVSSFAWMPGVRIYESKNLVKWHHVTDVLTHQIDLRGVPENCGIWAPQLSYADGEFHVLYTIVSSTKRPFKDCQNYLISTKRIEGPWSEPVYLNGSGFDPSLFHGKDGRKWVLNALWDYRMETPNKSCGIVMQEYDPQQKKLIGKPIKIFDGTRFAKTEAPHLIEREGWYYLITAEGGTGTGHCVTIARSKELFGPYEVDPNNPMLTSRNHPEWPLQCAGHASLVETLNHEWIIAHLCTRPIHGEVPILGRETALQKVEWTKEGWLQLANGGSLPESQIEVVMNDERSAENQSIFRDDFDQNTIDLEWNTLRIMPNERWCNLKQRLGYLRLLSGDSIQSLFEQHLLAVRQTTFHVYAETRLDFNPRNYLQQAGLVLYLDTDNYFYCYLTREDQKRMIRVMRSCRGEFEVLSEKMEVPLVGEIVIGVQIDEDRASFLWREADKSEMIPLCQGKDISYLSGGFTGNMIGICVQDMEQFEGSYADFAYFYYQNEKE